MTITLKEASLAAETNLRHILKHCLDRSDPLELRVYVKLYQATLMVAGVLSSLPGGGEEPILLAMNACNAIADSARNADDAGCIKIAERLRGVNRMLSPVVSRALWLSYRKD